MKRVIQNRWSNDWVIVVLGKSTTIRAIADLLPEIEVKDDPFNSHKSDLDLMGNEVKSAIKTMNLKRN
jgi:Mg-chelatase subunit ChlI